MTEKPGPVLRSAHAQPEEREREREREREIKREREIDKKKKKKGSCVLTRDHSIRLAIACVPE